MNVTPLFVDSSSHYWSHLEAVDSFRLSHAMSEGRNGLIRREATADQRGLASIAREVNHGIGTCAGSASEQPSTDMHSPSKAGTFWKGKGKAPAQEYDDLLPEITYRHLHSQNLGVKDPLRVIALCDSDAFYAACERVRLGLDPSVPLVVQQWESLIAVSYPAREFGISRMDKIKDTKKKCSNLVAVHVATYKEGEKEPGYRPDVDTRTHKVSLDLYRRESNKIIQLFKQALPDGEIEKASIDEAFIDLTRPVREVLLERFPYLAQVPLDAPQGADSPLPPPPPIDWSKLGELIPIHPLEEIDSGEGDDVTCTWHDVALSIAAELMAKIRGDVHKSLGYTMSAGISRNKFLAKLTASYKKPNSQSILRNSAIPAYLRPIPFQKIRFLGGKLGDALAKEYDVSAVDDLLAISLGVLVGQPPNIVINNAKLDEMQSKFGDNALWVYELLRGIDRSEVKEKSALFKSMLASKNLPTPITKAADGHQWLRVLAAELALRLRDARKGTPTLWPKTIVLHARKGYEASRSRQSPFPFTQDVTVDVIATVAEKLWKELTGTMKDLNVTAVQLAFTSIETAETGQQYIEGFFKPKETPRPLSKRIRSNSDGVSSVVDPAQVITEIPGPTPSGSSSFVCGRCNRQFSICESDVDHAEADHAAALAKLRMEHDDFHFAQDLENGTEVQARSKAPKRKKVAEPKGIAKFMIRK